MNRKNKRHPLGNNASQNAYALPQFVEARRENLLRRQKKNAGVDNTVKRPAPPITGRNRQRAVLMGWPFPLMQPWSARNCRTTDEGAGALIKRIAEVICYVKALNYSKQYMKDALAVILKHYTGLKDIKSMAAINRAIASELAKYGGYQLSRTELKTIWMM